MKHLLVRSQILTLSEVSLTYLPGNVTRIVAKAVGDFVLTSGGDDQHKVDASDDPSFAYQSNSASSKGTDVVTSRESTTVDTSPGEICTHKCNDDLVKKIKNTQNSA